MVAISATTRPLRRGEEDGREYYFLGDDEFQRRVDAGEFLEHVGYAGGRYGTLAAEVDRLMATGEAVILELEIEGAFAVRRRRPGTTLVFVNPPSLEDLERRMRARATDSAGEIEVRLAIAHEQLRARDEFDIVITTNSGYPLDMNLYQAVKGMRAAELIVRDGGTVVIAAE